MAVGCTEASNIHKNYRDIHIECLLYAALSIFHNHETTFLRRDGDFSSCPTEIVSLFDIYLLFTIYLCEELLLKAGDALFDSLRCPTAGTSWMLVMVGWLGRVGPRL